MPDKFLTINQVAKALEAGGMTLSSKTIGRMAKRGQFPQPVDVGGRRMWTEGAVKRWLAKLQMEAAA